MAPRKRVRVEWLKRQLTKINVSFCRALKKTDRKEKVLSNKFLNSIYFIRMNRIFCFSAGQLKIYLLKTNSPPVIKTIHLLIYDRSVVFRKHAEKLWPRYKSFCTNNGGSVVSPTSPTLSNRFSDEMFH